MMERDLTEKRRFTRAPFEADTLVRHAGAETAARSVAISLKAICLVTSSPHSIPLHGRVQLTLQLQDLPNLEHELNLIGTVVRQESRGIVVEFGPMDLDTFIQVKRIVSLNSGDEDRVMEEFASHVAKKKKEISDVLPGN